tara:strand:+ start:62 stop:268 length:207 start_codon:yes stop_codon:yes gene_type:complete
MIKSICGAFFMEKKRRFLETVRTVIKKRSEGLVWRVFFMGYQIEGHETTPYPELRRSGIGSVPGFGQR